MGDTFENPSSRKSSKAKNVVSNKKVSNSCLLASSSKSSSQKSLRHRSSFNHSRMVRGTVGDATLFLLKLAALETVRRFSRARCPIVWDGMRVMQVLCLPPFKWIGRWAPFEGLVKVMQTLSRPLLVLSIATAFSDQSTSDAPSDPIDNSQGLNGSQSSSDSPSELSHVQSTPDTGIDDEASQIQLSTDWLSRLYAELQNQGISLPERINEDELQRFHAAANGDFSCLLSSVKKTIQWRETYKILSGQELEIWSNMVFWHGFDVKYRPCLIVRLGLACVSLPSQERPRFLQAVVSQVEHGILHLVDPENPEITVLVDCEGLSPLRFPMQLMRSCSAIFQEHFPNRLGFLFVIRLPPVVRVIARTFIQVLKPVTRQKLKIEGQMYQRVLMENFQTLPSYLGGICKCKRCLNIGIYDKRLHQVNGESDATERRVNVNCTEGMPASPLNNTTEMRINGNHDQVLLAAAVGILVFWALMAFIAGKYDPEIRLTLPF